MITTFEVGSVFKIVDQATPVLRNLAREVGAFNVLVKDARTNLSGLGRMRLTGLDQRIKGLATAAGDLQLKFGNTFAAMNTGTAAALADTRALAAEWRAVAVSAAAASRAMRLPSLGARPALPGAGHGGSGGGTGLHVSSFSAPLPGGVHARFRPTGSNVGLAAMGALAYGVYEESEIEDIAARAMLTGQIKVDAGMRDTAAFKRIRDLIQSTSSRTGFSSKDVGEAVLATERQFGGLDFARRMDVEETLFPFAAFEARMKETSLPEAFQSLVGLVHQTGTYDPAGMKKLANAFSYTSMVTPVGLPQFERALSYSLPILHAGMGMDPAAGMFLTAMTQTAGITNTKSGTWIREFFGRLMPNTAGTKTALEHNRLLRSIHLLNDQDQPTWFEKDFSGKVEWMASIPKLSGMMSAELGKIPDTERMGVMRQIWGAQGGGFAALMNVPQFVEQLAIVGQKMQSFQGGNTGLDEYMAGSPAQKARDAFADLQVVLMDIGSYVLPPLTHALEDFDVVLKLTSKFLPSSVSPSPQGETIPQSTLWGNVRSGITTGAVEGGAIGALAGSAMPGPGTAAGLFLGAGAGAVFGGADAAVRYLFGPGGGAASRDQSWNVIPPPSPDKAIQVTTTINLDGRQVAEVVTNHQAKLGAGPAEGAPYHDSTYSISPLDFNLVQ